MQWQPTVIIIGAGFGGLAAALALSNKAVNVLLVDRENFHTFTPLLYQVATSGLNPSEIAYPIRSIFKQKQNISFMLGEVTGISTSEQSVTVQTSNATLVRSYDYLITAAGSITNFFGNNNVQEKAFVLKDLSSAVLLRNHILKLFERPAWTQDSDLRTALTTIVVVGGGPTGLETAGALHELYNYLLRKEYRDLQARVILVEASDHLLTAFPDQLQESAQRQLSSLGVELVFHNPVQEIGDGYLELQDGQRIPSHTVIWAAGVKASPLGQLLDIPLQRGGRIPVAPTLEVEGLQHVYAVGDIAYLLDDNGTPYPQLSPVAKQQGTLAAKNILRGIHKQEPELFKYRDRGIMATIGRSRAVAWIFNRIAFSGYVAWVMWLGLHLIWLIGFRNRISVLIGWIWNYLTYDRSVRIILEQQTTPAPDPTAESQVYEQ